MKSSPSNIIIRSAFLLLLVVPELLWIDPTTSTTTAWMMVPQTRKEWLQSFTATIGGAATTVSTSFSSSSFPAIAATTTTDPSIFNHQYSDPKHPNCRRIVSAKQDGTATVSGTDGTPGCPEDGSGTVWRLPGEVEGSTILVDFSAKVR